MLFLIFLSSFPVVNPALVRLLSGFDNTISDAAVIALASNPAADLLAIADDDALAVSVRGRALSLAAARFAGAEVRAGALALAQGPDARMRVKAVKALKTLALQASDSELLSALSLALRDDNVFVRLQAVHALSALPEARVVLAQHLNVELEPAVRDLIGEKLTR